MNEHSAKHNTLDSASRPSDCACAVLATDLDGTLIPLDGNPQNRESLVELAEHIRRADVTLGFVTGRHLASTQDAITRHQLPRPDWIICDVGTTICVRDANGAHQTELAYHDQLTRIMGPVPFSDLPERIRCINTMRLQEPEKQGRFKLSFYTGGSELAAAAAQLRNDLRKWNAPCSVIASRDPFTGDGLIDVLPVGVSKAYALGWWMTQQQLARDAFVYAGDSGNDLAVFESGCRVIIVGNTQREIVDRVKQTHARAGWANRLYCAARPATCGVLEGCRWFGIIPSGEAS